MVTADDFEPDYAGLRPKLQGPGQPFRAFVIEEGSSHGLPRFVNLLGIDSVMCPMPYRQAIWQRLATDLKPRNLDRIAQVISLNDLPDAVNDILQGNVKGRLLVSPQA